MHQVMEVECEDPSQIFLAWEDLYGWELMASSEVMLAKVGLQQDCLTRKMSQLSHGERARAWILRFMLYPFDLYLLDEPDNHLDSEGLNLLSDWLNSLPALIMVSHNRGYLDSVTNQTWFLKAGKLSQTQGGILTWETEKSRMEELERAKYKKLSQKADSLGLAAQNAAKKASSMEGFKFQRSVSNSGSVCKRDEGSGKIVRKDKFQSSASVLKNRANQAQCAAIEAKPFVEKSRSLKIQPTREDIFLCCESPAIHLKSGDRLRIKGKNGSGKSTLLNKLAGNSVFSQAAILAYQDQDAKILPVNGLAWNWIATNFSDLEPEFLLTILGCFGLASLIKNLDFATMSIGERVRLLLGTVLARRPDILLLDEPVNHLDIEARQLLSEGLRDYRGILVFVSHDEDFAQSFSDALEYDCSPMIVCRPCRQNTN